MATISLKRKKRYRVQITISQACWERYSVNLQLAQSLGAEIDYSREFEAWFNRQNDQVLQELEKMRANPAAKGGINGDN
ncbi:MAG TPA: hypothetical protein VIH45_09820 [Desulfuromonadaceae bacterium]